MDFSSKINSVQVQEPPSWIIKPFDIKGPELDKVEFKCQALGSPPPKYTWVDKEGIDATEKEGKKSGHNFVWIVSSSLSKSNHQKQTFNANEKMHLLWNPINTIKSFLTYIIFLDSFMRQTSLQLYSSKGWKLDETTGTLTAFQLERKDEGEYTCIAENNAGRLEAAAYLKVIVRPRVQELINQTFPVGREEARLTCLASGDPLPKIVWRKWSRK